MNYYTLIPTISLLVNFFLFSYIYAIGRKNSAGRAYLIFLTAVALGDIMVYLIWNGIAETAIVPLSRVIYGLLCLASFLYLHFVSTLIKKPRNFLYIIFFIICALSIILTLSTDTVYRYPILHYPYGREASQGYFLDILRFATIFPPACYSIVLILRSMSATDDFLEIKQLRLLLIGFILTVTLGILTSFILPDLAGLKILPRITFSVNLIQSIFIFVAITRYRFLYDSIQSLAYKIFSEVKESIIIFDQAGRFIEINNQALELLGLKRESCKEMLAHDVFPEIYSFSNDYRNLQITVKTSNGDREISLSQISLTKSGLPSGKLVIMYDITGEKTFERALEASEIRYRKTLDSLDNYIYVIDRDLRINLINETLRVDIEKIGMAEDIIGKKIFDAFPFLDKTELYNELMKVFSTGTTLTSEKKISFKGIDIYIETRKIPMMEGDRIVAITGVITNISEIKKAEEALRISEEKFYNAFNASPMPMSINTFYDGKFIDINESMVKISRFESNEIIGKSVEEIGIFHDREDFKIFTMTLVKEKKIANHYCDIKTKTGETVSIALSAEIVNMGGTDYVISAAIDMTGQRKAETKIKEQYDEIQAQYNILEVMNEELSNTHDKLLRINRNLALEKERLSTMLRSIGEGVISVDNKGRIDLINTIAEAITGWKNTEAIGTSIEMILPLFNEKTNETCRDLIDKVINTGDINEMRTNTIIRNRRGDTRHISSIAAPIHGDKGVVDGAIIAFRDITDRKKMEDELFRASKIESLAVFAGGIAHDFNNLLTSILGNASLAMLNAKKNDKNNEILREIEKASLRAKDLTQQLLTFSKGGAPIKQITSIQDLLIDTTDFVLRGSPIKCTYSIAKDLWNADVDSGQISQVIHNLILNASQSMSGRGEITLSAKNRKVIARDRHNLRHGNYICITIADQGKGIPKEVLKNIFDPFFTTKKDGSGLGLSVTYSIIKKHDGAIDVISKVGKGTTFEILLPASSGKVEKKPGLSCYSNLKGGAILLMDDDEMVQEVGNKILCHLGFTVQIASNGEEAIELYKNAKNSHQPFDAVIMDLTIPGGLGGKETIKILKDYDPQVIAIVSSGYSNDPVMSRYKDYGFCGVVAKPYRYEELADVLNRALN